jgi:hypothetical protein
MTPIYQVSRMLLGKMSPTDLINVELSQTFNLYKKNAVSEKHNKVNAIK